MSNIKDLKEYLIIEEVNKKIIKDNKIELLLSLHMLQFTEDTLFQKLNDMNLKNNEMVNRAIGLLFVQGNKSFKSGVILCLNGFFTPSIIITRNVIETIFNIKYILDKKSESYEMANNYLNNISKWTNETIKNRAYSSLDSTLYNLYRITSDYTHSNYLATSQNVDEFGFLSAFPSDEKVNNSLTLANSVYYYLLEFMCKYYEIDFSPMENIEKSQEFKHRLKTYKMFNYSKRYYD